MTKMERSDMKRKFDWKTLTFEQEPVRETFAATPLIDAMEAEQAGNATLPSVSRDEALSVPGVMYARNTICSIANLPLKTYNSKWKLINNPLLREIDPTRTNQAVLADTLEDLFFYKYSYWRVLDRAADDFPISAEYIDRSRVSDPTVPYFNGTLQDRQENTLRIDGKNVSWADVIRFESPNEAFLRHGARVIKRALELDKTAAKYARNPRPLNYFRPTDGVDPFDDAGIRAFLRKWKNWLVYEVTGYVPAGMELVQVDQPNPQEMQLIESQQQVNLSIAVMVGLNPKDFGVDVSTRTYQNVQDDRQERINQVFKAYMGAIADRLTKGDVTKQGHQVFFDLTEYMRANEKERAEVQDMKLGNGSTTLDEVRNEDHKPALPKEEQPINPETPKEVTDGDS